MSWCLGATKKSHTSFTERREQRMIAKPVITMIKGPILLLLLHAVCCVRASHSEPEKKMRYVSPLHTFFTFFQHFSPDVSLRFSSFVPFLCLSSDSASSLSQVSMRIYRKVWRPLFEAIATNPDKHLTCSDQKTRSLIRL